MNSTGICDHDLIAMSYLKTKYPGIFADIDQNRGMYTELLRYDVNYLPLTWDKNYRDRYFENLFLTLGYSGIEKEAITSLLGKIFPAWKSGHSNDSNDDLRQQGKIAHRDLLDMYFSYGVSQKTFNIHSSEVEKVERFISKNRSEGELIKKLIKFNEYALKNGGGDTSRLLARRLIVHRSYAEQESHEEYLFIWRCWLRSFLISRHLNTDAANSVLASILSGASQVISRANPKGASMRLARTNPVVSACKYLFEDVEKYLNDPHDALLMLLFILPERGNGYFEDYISSGTGWTDLYGPTLQYVDEYFLVRRKNVFKTHDWPTWQFVLYQWALSSCVELPKPNPRITGSTKRHQSVNEYVFELLESDDQLAYDFILHQFWSNDGWDSEDYKWRVESKLAQYHNVRDMKRLHSIAMLLTEASNLSVRRRQQMKDFAGEIKLLLEKRKK